MSTLPPPACICPSAAAVVLSEYLCKKIAGWFFVCEQRYVKMVGSEGIQRGIVQAAKEFGMVQGAAVAVG